MSLEDKIHKGCKSAEKIPTTVSYLQLLQLILLNAVDEARPAHQLNHWENFVSLLQLPPLNTVELYPLPLKAKTR